MSNYIVKKIIINCYINCSLADWGKETTTESNLVENLTINSAINQVADLVSAVLLHFISPTYKSLIQTPKEQISYDNPLQFDLISTTITLLSNNELILRQLVKKWINIVRGKLNNVF